MHNACQSHVLTPLGAALVQVIDARLRRVDESCAVQIAAHEVHPKLPSGMRLDSVIRIDVTLTALEDGIAPQILFVLDNQELEGSGDPGEWLESIQFEHDGTVLSLGVTDRDWALNQGVEKGFLPKRFGNFAETGGGYEVDYRPAGLSITFGELMRGEAVSCSLALAHVSGVRRPEDHYWTWYGVGAVLP